MASEVASGVDDVVVAVAAAVAVGAVLDAAISGDEEIYGRLGEFK